MGHKTASAYGYATHTNPQGFIIRPPLLTTSTVFLLVLLVGLLLLIEFLDHKFYRTLRHERSEGWRRRRRRASVLR